MACHSFLGFYERSRKGGGNLKRVEQLPSNFSLKDEASSSSGPSSSLPLEPGGRGGKIVLGTWLEMKMIRTKRCLKTVNIFAALCLIAIRLTKYFIFEKYISEVSHRVIFKVAADAFRRFLQDTASTSNILMPRLSLRRILTSFDVIYDMLYEKDPFWT